MSGGEIQQHIERNNLNGSFRGFWRINEEPYPFQKDVLRPNDFIFIFLTLPGQDIGHWILLLKTKKYNVIFDSENVPGLLELIKQESGLDNLIKNDTDFQARSNFCAPYSLFVLDKLIGKDVDVDKYREVLGELSVQDKAKNKDLLVKFFSDYL